MLSDETCSEILPIPAAALRHRATLLLILVIEQHAFLIKVVLVLILNDLVVFFGLVAGRKDDLKTCQGLRRRIGHPNFWGLLDYLVFYLDSEDLLVLL